MRDDHRKFLCGAGMCMLVIGVALTIRASEPAPNTIMSLASTAFKNGDEIPQAYTYALGSQCNGDNISPPLFWVGAPAGTKSFVVTLVDLDAHGGWTHWVLFNIPSNVTNLQGVVGGPVTGIRGKNDFGNLGYGGPCPPSGRHRYVFELRALDATLDVLEGASKAKVDAAAKGHVLATATYVGVRSR